jgi:hypothetical protein
MRSGGWRNRPTCGCSALSDAYGSCIPASPRRPGGLSLRLPPTIPGSISCRPTTMLGFSSHSAHTTELLKIDQPIVSALVRDRLRSAPAPSCDGEPSVRAGRHSVQSGGERVSERLSRPRRAEGSTARRRCMMHDQADSLHGHRPSRGRRRVWTTPPRNDPGGTRR